MNQQLKNKILTPYPDWHKNPLRLSIPEMENPYLVLKEFFECYHLTDIRGCLKEWLNEVLRPDEILQMDYVHVYDQVEKLIEAAWLLHTRQCKKKNKKPK